MSEYDDFLQRKGTPAMRSGFEPNEISKKLFDWQRDIVRWALRCGKAAIWADCGLGKTAMQLAWADAIVKHTGRDVLILAPLAVTNQTKREADKFGYRVKVVRSQDDVEAGIAVSNYEMLDRFNPSAFVGIVLDESSILKAYDGSTRKQITESFATTPYRLACTATPAPNDHMELGTHAEFIGVMTRSEMLSMFFIHDGGDTAAWRLKGHAQRDFWRWLSSWAVMIRKPSDVGASDEGFRLPPLTIEPMIVQSEHRLEGYLVPMEAVTLSEQRAARRASLAEREQKCTSIVNADSQPGAVWGGLDDESEALAAAIPDSVEGKIGRA